AWPRTPRRSGVPGIRTGRIDAVFGHRLFDGGELDAALVGQALQRRDDDAVPVHLEKGTQRCARVAAAEAVGAQAHVTAYTRGRRRPDPPTNPAWTSAQVTPPGNERPHGRPPASPRPPHPQ